MRVAFALAVLVATPSAASVRAQTSFEATTCGASAFSAADADARAFERFTITIPATLDVAAAIHAVVVQIQAGGAVAAAFEPVIACRAPTWTIAALVRQARMYDVLANAMAAVTTWDPALDDRVRQAMAPQIAPVECLAVVATCSRFAPAAPPRS